MARALLLLLLVLICGSLQAAVPQAPRFRLLGVSDGVPHTTVVALARDRAGYIWLATHDGLARYDGIDFRVWRHVADDPASLPGNIVQALHIDAQDRIWVATEGGGLSVLDADRRGFRHFRMADHPQIGSDDIWALASHDGDVWFGTYEGGLHRMDADGVITRYMPEAGNPRSLPSETVLALAFDAAGRLWVGTTAGIARWTGRDFERVALPGEDPAPMIFSLNFDGQRVWIGATSGAFFVAADGAIGTPSWSPMFERPNVMVALTHDKNGYWIGSQRSLWRAGDDGIPIPVAIDPGVRKRVLALLQQPDGALWVHAAGIGLGYLRSDWRQLAEFKHSDTGLSGDLYRGIAVSRDGGVWLTGNTGVVERLDRDGLVEHLPAKVLAQLEGIRFRSVVEDAGGRLWLGHRHGVIRVDRDGQVQRWNDDDATDAALQGSVDLLRLAPDGRSLWSAAIGGGVQQRDLGSGRVLRNLLAGPAHGLDDGDLDAMAFAADGSLWVAGSRGLARLDAQRNRFVPIAALAGEHVFGFDFDADGGLWLHRLTGLEHWRSDGADGWKRVAMVGQADGIPAVESGDLRVDASGRPWLATARGLFRWDPTAGHVRHFGVEDGLSSQEFVPRSLTLTPDGVLAAGLADGGVVLLDTRRIERTRTVPDLRLASVAVRRHGRWQPQPLQTRLELTPEDRELRVRMRLLAFDDPSANRYWSKLDGYDNDWVALGASGERVFSGLTAGDHVLHLRASDAAGNAAEENVFRFSVLPPWWRTPWAYAGFLALAVLLLWWLSDAYRSRLQRRHAMQLMEHKRELAEQASLAKTRFLATLGHEVRTPMTGVLGMSELLLGTTLDSRQRGYTQSIQHAGEHLLRLVNDALDLARIEADRLELADSVFDLRDVIDDVTALMAPLAAQRGLDFERVVSDDAPRGLRGDATRIRQILLNLIGNAIKFTERGSVTLRVMPLLDDGVRADGVRFEISDTGPGLNEEQKTRLFRRFEQAEGARTAARYGGSGLGLAISQELAAAMGGRIGVDSQPGEGTCFNVELPLPAAAIEASKAAVATTDTATRPLDLLLVEDDPTVAEVIAGLLRARGHRVTHAGHGLAALAEIAGGRFDMALLDLDLPGLDGFALARQLRTQGFSQPLLAITARADADAEPLARAAGFNGFLRKPLTGDMLAEAIEALLPDAHPER